MHLASQNPSAIYAHSLAVWIVGAVLPMRAVGPIGVVDAVWRVLASVSTERVGDAVRIKLIGVQVAMVSALAVIKLRAVERQTDLRKSPAAAAAPVLRYIDLRCSSRGTGLPPPWSSPHKEGRRLELCASLAISLIRLIRSRTHPREGVECPGALVAGPGPALRSLGCTRYAPPGPFSNLDRG